MDESRTGRTHTLILVRHGRTAWSGQRRFIGHRNIPLSAAGQGDAQAAAQRVSHWLRQHKRTHNLRLLSSDLERAAATAQAISRHIHAPTQLDPRLREEYLGEWEGLQIHEVQREHPAPYTQWCNGRTDAFGGREGLDKVAARATAAIFAALQEGDGRHPRTLVAVTHLNTAIALLGHLTGLDRRTWTAVPDLSPGELLICYRVMGQTHWHW